MFTKHTATRYLAGNTLLVIKEITYPVLSKYAGKLESFKQNSRLYLSESKLIFYSLLSYKNRTVLKSRNKTAVISTRVNLSIVTLNSLSFSNQDLCRVELTGSWHHYSYGFKFWNVRAEGIQRFAAYLVVKLWTL